MQVAISSYVHTSNSISILYIYTVKPVYNDHLWDQGNVVCIDRWSLYTGIGVHSQQTQ